MSQKEINTVLTKLDEKYKGTSKFWYSLAFVFRDTFICYLIYQICYTNMNYVLYSGLMGTAMTGLWVIGHECGHGAFGDNWIQNDFFGFIIHSALLVPYFSWKYSHNKHHKYTNHLILGESHVPSTKKTYLSLRKMLGDDAFAVVDIFFHLFIGWPLYLFYNFSGGRTAADLKTKLVPGIEKSHFTSTSQVMKQLASRSPGVVCILQIFWILVRWKAKRLPRLKVRSRGPGARNWMPIWPPGPRVKGDICGDLSRKRT